MKQILLIEDDNAVRTLIVRELINAGYIVLEAANGKEGVALYKKTHPDLVITDVIMPEKDGIEVIRELRQDFPDVKIIAISGGGKFGLDFYLRASRSLGTKQTLDKPFAIEELLVMVRQLLAESDNSP